MTASGASATIQTASVNTNNAKRDDHLRSADFFDVNTHPTMTFTSRSVEAHEDGTLTVSGDLTLRGVTQPVQLRAEFGGMITDPQGKERVAFTATTTINRQDFGVSWNKVMDTGGLVVGDDVQITLEIEGVRTSE